MSRLLDVVMTDCSEAKGKSTDQKQILIYCGRKSLKEMQTSTGAVEGSLFYMVMKSSLQIGSLPSLQ